MAFESDEAHRAYFREYNKGWYRRHRERLLEERKQHNQELRLWLRHYKSKLCCMVCGESHPACLQFHHRERKDKSFGIGSVLGRTHLSINRLKKRLINVMYFAVTVMQYFIGKKRMVMMIREK
jgi:hypothetical protein